MDADDEDLRRVMREFRASVSDRFDAHDRRFDELEGRMGRLEGRMGGLEGRMGGLEGRMGGLEGRMSDLERAMIEQGEFLGARMQTMETGIMNAIRDWGRTIDARLTRVEQRLDGAA